MSYWRILAILVSVAACHAQAATVGPDVTSRRDYDGANGITFIQRGYASPIAGSLTQWTLWAEPGALTLQVFRPFTDSLGTGFQLIGENPATITTEGLNVIAIPAVSQIAVQAGDVIGWRYDGNYTYDASIGNISFDYIASNPATTVWTYWPTSPVPMGGKLYASDLTNDAGRLYSVAAEISPATAVPVPASFPAGIALLGSGLIVRFLRRGK